MPTEVPITVTTTITTAPAIDTTSTMRIHLIATAAPTMLTTATKVPLMVMIPTTSKATTQVPAATPARATTLGMTTTTVTKWRTENPSNK